MSRRRFWLPLSFLVMLAPAGAEGSENFPATIKTALAMTGPEPPCITCHDTEAGGSDMVNRPVGRRFLGYGLTGGDTQMLTTILGKMRDARDDSDGDGLTDIEEITAGGNPNVSSKTGKQPDDYPPPVYGCQSSGGRVPFAAPSGQWTLAAAALFLILWFRGRARPNVRPLAVTRQVASRSRFWAARWLLCLSAVFGACQNAPLDVVEGVDLTRFEGRWYEIARLPRATQIDCAGTTASYSLTTDRDLIVTNECSVGGLNGTRRRLTASAKVTNAAVPAKLSVDFGGFFGDYWIIDLDREGYRYAVVGHPTRQYLWILSRDRTLEAGQLAAILERATQKGFDTGKLEYTKHEP